MPKRTVDEILGQLRGIVGDDHMTDDAVIALVEDITDTTTNDGTDWEKMYRENDAAWRKRYTERFYTREDERDPEKDEKSEEEEKKYTFDELFTETENKK